MYDKAALGTIGVLGVSYATYKLMFPWLALDAKDIRKTRYAMKLFQEAIDSQAYLIDVFERHANNNPDKCFIIYMDRIFTYGGVNIQANKLARVMKSYGLKKGDTVGLFMHNEPAFIWSLLGLQKLGIAVTLLNYNLRHQSLTHCLRVSKANALISSSDADTVRAITDVIGEVDGLPVFVHDLPPDEIPAQFIALADLLAAVPGDAVDKAWRSPTKPLDPVCYVFTSGTTGTPKPALLTQIRGQGTMQVFKSQADLTSEDILYTCLPLYHSAALFLGLLGVINVGATVVLSRKFSASHFWEDCRKHKATGIQYIGELCRYLLAQPPNPRDGDNCVRFAYGNGLRVDIWQKFQDRFNIPHIYEFFGATEGAVGLLNNHNKVGAVGRYSPYMAWLDNNSKLLVRYDEATAQPLRDKNGRCIRVKRGETGLFLVRFPPHAEPQKIYLSSPEKVEKKLVRNVLQPGDIFFNYGDLLYQDSDYFYYFVDRIGDTFRWKGENVSTLEVANILTGLDFITDANVYGVHLPDHDGRVGMACLVLTEGITDLTEDMCAKLFSQCKYGLPTYARPLFIRVQGKMELTVTWKQRKVELVKEGFDLQQISDPLYYMDGGTQSYKPLTQTMYRHFLAGQAKL